MLLSKGLNVASDSYPTGTGFLPNLSSYMTPTKLTGGFCGVEAIE